MYQTKKKSSKRTKMIESEPMGPKFSRFVYEKYLTEYEKSEIMKYEKIYYTGSNGPKTIPNPEIANNGFDKADMNYILHKGDHIAYRYEINMLIGRGCFSQVISCKDHRMNCDVALKIWSSDKRFSQLSHNEAKILRRLAEDDPTKEFHIVHMIDRFHFRGHTCIVFPLMGPNLYYVLHKFRVNGLEYHHVKQFTKSLVYALVLLRKNSIIHCDLKPENILLRADMSDIEVGDFGSSCHVNGTLYTYIQTRHYRAPEVLFHAPYDCQIDMWSLGCIVYELFTASPLLRGDDEQDQVSVIFGCLGLPPDYLLSSFTKYDKYVSSNNIPRYCEYDEITKTIRGSINCKNIYRSPPGSLPLEKQLAAAPEEMLNFTKQCLTYDPKLRLNPVSALLHPFIRDKDTEALYQRMKHLVSTSESTSINLADSVATDPECNLQNKVKIKDKTDTNKLTNCAIVNTSQKVDRDEASVGNEEITLNEKIGTLRLTDMQSKHLDAVTN